MGTIIVLIALCLLSTGSLTFELFHPELFDSLKRLFNPLDLKVPTPEKTQEKTEAGKNTSVATKPPLQTPLGGRQPFMYDLQKWLLDPKDSIIMRSRRHFLEAVGEDKVKALTHIVPHPEEQDEDWKT